MRITIFGATGRTGLLVVHQALNAGYEVTALVRNPDKLGPTADRLHVIAGSLADPALVGQAIAGVGAVVSVLGPTSNAPVFEVSQGTANILAAMASCGVRRLVVTTGAGVGDPHDKPGLMDRGISALLKLSAGNVLEDMQRSIRLVRQSDLDWTIVRAPMLTDGPVTATLRVGYLGHGVGSRLSRANLADFVVGQIEHSAYIRQSPVISD